MLGITVPDAVLIGTLVISVLAAWRGNKTAIVEAKNNPPPEPPAAAVVGATMADASAIRELTHAIERHGEIMRAHIPVETQRMYGLIEEQFDRLLRRLDNISIQKRR